MKQVKNILKDVVDQIDMMNTIGGGTALTSVNIEKLEDHVEIKLSSPGIDSESYNILLKGNQLVIYSVLNMPEDFLTEDENNDESPIVPLFSKTFDLPPFVDIDQIDAVFEENELKVILPFKSEEDSIKKIDIRHF